MSRDSFVFYASDYKSIKDMPDEQLGRFFRAICEYALNGIAKIDDKELKYAFNLLIDKIKRDQAKYDEVSKRRSEAGKKAWKKQMQANGGGSGSVSVSDSESDNIEIKKIFLFEKFICPVNAEFARFWAHYAKNDWVDGNGIAITNRLACAKNWNTDAMACRLDISSAKAWKVIYNLLKEREKSELMVTGLYGFNLKNNTLIILCTKQLYEFVESNLNDDIGAVIRREFDCQKVEYNIVANNEEQ